MITHLVAYLNGYSALTALIGNRLYPGLLPQSVPLPAITYQRISRAPASVRSGRDLLVASRYQFNINGRVYADVDAISTQLKLALQAYTRTAAPRVDRIFIDNERDDDEPAFDDLNYYRRIVDAIIWHEE